MAFGNKITELRKTAGLSQQAVASQLGIHAPILGRYERNEIKPSIETAKKIADFYHVSLDYLLSDSGVILKDQHMLERVAELEALPSQEKEHIIYALDAMLRDAKTKKAYVK